MGETTYPCAGCGATFFERYMKWRKEDDALHEEGHEYPYCASCFEEFLFIDANLKRIGELHTFAKELLVKWEVDAPKSSEYLKGYISALEIVLALLKG